MRVFHGEDKVHPGGRVVGVDGLGAAGEEQPKGAALGVQHGGRAPRQRKRGQMPQALVAVAGGVQQLAAPYRAVLPVARAVERHAQHPPGERVFAHDGGDMRVVVLHLDQRQLRLSCLLARPFAREVLGVKVAGQRVCLQVEKLLVARPGLVPGLPGA